jgi:hypothetical protein
MGFRRKFPLVFVSNCWEQSRHCCEQLNGSGRKQKKTGQIDYFYDFNQMCGARWCPVALSSIIIVCFAISGSSIQQTSAINAGAHEAPHIFTKHSIATRKELPAVSQVAQLDVIKYADGDASGWLVIDYFTGGRRRLEDNENEEGSLSLNFCTSAYFTTQLAVLMGICIEFSSYSRGTDGLVYHPLIIHFSYFTFDMK